MALIKSTIFSAVRGSINGTVFSQNRYGAYARNRTVLANPNTPNQILARAGLSTTSQEWKTLGTSDRVGWTNYAAGTPVPNRLGDMIHLSGINMFVKTNAFLRFIGNAPTNTPPTTPGLASPLISAVISITDSSSVVPNAVNIDSFVGGGNTGNDYYGLWISRPVSPGTTFFKGPWNYIGPITGATLATSQTDTGLTITTGQIFFIKLRYRDAANKMSIDFIQGPIQAINIP